MRKRGIRVVHLFVCHVRVFEMNKHIFKNFSPSGKPDVVFPSQAPIPPGQPGLCPGSFERTGANIALPR